MRNSLSLKWMLALACVALGASCAEAAERMIRPRRTNRPTAGIRTAAPAVASPVAEDGASQAPLKTLTPPDSALLKSGLMRPVNLMREFGEECADASAKDSQEKGDNPPEKTPEAKEQAGVADNAKDADKLVDDLPPYVPYDNYQNMNRQRQDFHPPMEAAEAEKTVPSPEPAQGTAMPPKYREPLDTADRTETASVSMDAPEENAEISPAPPLLYADGATEPRTTMTVVEAPPTPAEVENYRRRLEFRLLERYNNLPEHAGDVGKVTVVLSKPLQPSLDGMRLRAEFDQLVYDTWGKRIPSLEKEYYVVTFSAGGVRQVRSDPSIRVGLNHERTYSEPAPGPEIAEKIRTMPPDHAFRAARNAEVPRVKMPDWWRPEFSDDGY